MAREPVRGLFITGTDTNVGKTYVGALIARSLRAQGRRVGVYKPVASGCPRQDGELICEDALALWKAAGSPGELARVCPQVFHAPMAPHLAAAAEGKQLDALLLRTGLEYWRERSDIVIVEGAGGLLSPLGDEYAADLAHDFGFPLVIVVPNRLGAINQGLMTLSVARNHNSGSAVAALVLNNMQLPPGDQSTTTNFAELRQRSSVPVFQIEVGGASCAPEVDWFNLAGSVKI